MPQEQAAVRSGVWINLITAIINNAPYDPLPNSTLNHALNILPGVNDGQFLYPSICAYAIGLGDTERYTGASGVSRTVPVYHRCTDTGLHKLRPMVLRDAENDLTAGQRELFALRRSEIWRGRPHWAYYASWLPPLTTPPTLEYISITNGVPSTPIAWTPSAEDLTPIGTTMPNQGVNQTVPDFLRSSVARIIAWNEFQRAEYLNVASIMYDDEREALVNDVGIIAARKRQIQVPAGPGGGTFMFNEAIMATVAAWVPKSYDAFRDGTFEMTFNSSIEEGVYKFTNVGLNV
jgi:hypothetical protein